MRTSTKEWRFALDLGLFLIWIKMGSPCSCRSRHRFFKVPPGKYEVTADNRGDILTRSAQVRAKGGTELVLRWKAPQD